MKKMIKNMLIVSLLTSISYANYAGDGQIALDNKDYKKAFKLFSQSCDNDNPDVFGCRIVGAMYEDGNPVQRNYFTALEYYEKACNLGDDYSCERIPTLKAKMPVCSESEISFINDKRYFEVAGSDKFPSILADSKTIQIDKKNKTIKVWTVWLASQKGRDDVIKVFSKYDNYDSFGYRQSLDIINYGTMKSKRVSASDNNCDGSIIYSGYKSGEWQDIYPGSVMEGSMERIKKKYNLK